MPDSEVLRAELFSDSGKSCSQLSLAVIVSTVGIEFVAVPVELVLLRIEGVLSISDTLTFNRYRMRPFGSVLTPIRDQRSAADTDDGKDGRCSSSGIEEFRALDVLHPVPPPTVTAQR
ncbi:hypothetical protein A4X20_27010 [Mycolicibacterium iranicum]|uniref:Uncharacterized protein n=1 Tax=Mycolicibacterium iranicum TaxID=912594 RepID=A0A178LRC4_MYCIR|nr:hypothetical protein A4X20_27010 [Mycolicibacterium iranicum]